jgi:hypothetical protein
MKDMKMQTLFLNLKVPIQCEPLVGAPALTFSHWLPLAKENGLEIVDGDIRLVLWFDIKATWWAFQPTEEEIKNHVNVLAHYINADLEVNGLPEDLAKYIRNRDLTRPVKEEERSLQTAYESLGRQIFSLLLTRFNRLIAYARAKKGQYWLVEYDLDVGRMYTFFNIFEARGRFDDEPWFRFQPAVGDHLNVVMQSETRYISESEWPQVQSFVGSSSKPPLVGELLAGAEQLAENGHRRSALTEAITALEIALYAFARSANANSAFGGIMAERLATPTLIGQVNHFGLSGSFGYLLPLILSEKILPTNILKDCQLAITQRQNVVHNGQRDVDKKILQKCLSSIRYCCEVLESLTTEGT